MTGKTPREIFGCTHRRDLFYETTKDRGKTPAEGGYWHPLSPRKDDILFLQILRQGIRRHSVRERVPGHGKVPSHEEKKGPVNTKSVGAR